MIRESWYHDYHKRKFILKAKTGRSSRRRPREITISPRMLNNPRLVVLIVLVGILAFLFFREAKTVLGKEPRYIAKNIIVENNRIVSKDIIIDLLQKAGRKGHFSMIPGRVARILEEDPDIEYAEVERISPDIIKIALTERIPYVVLSSGGDKKYILDRNGIVLLRWAGHLSRQLGQDIPEIKGLEIESLCSGEQCTQAEIREIISILHAGDDAGWGNFIEPREVRIYNENEVWIHTRERILIKLKMGDIEEQMEKFMIVLNDVVCKGEIIRTVDLRFQDVYVR